jgi:hypothetical protein
VPYGLPRSRPCAEILDAGLARIFGIKFNAAGRQLHGQRSIVASFSVSLGDAHGAFSLAEKAPDYESGGREFESLQARQKVKSMT